MRTFPLLVIPALALATACTPPSRTQDASSTAATPVPTATFDGSRLDDYHWRLADATSADGARIDALFPRADRPLQLDFAEGRVGVSNACNGIGGSYALEGDRFSTGELMQTMMACPDDRLMQSDAAIGDRLRAGGRLHFDDRGALVFTTADGDTLRFDAVPTAATRFGGPGERVFMEVAAQRVPCPHAMIPDYQCLHVREIVYGDNGVKESSGEWQFLYQDIEGYTHEPGVRNVLRLERFTVPNPPADGSSIAYVLDMVVESEVVEP